MLLVADDSMILDLYDTRKDEEDGYLYLTYTEKEDFVNLLAYSEDWYIIKLYQDQ